jgi:aminoglycoside phosphotransferase family enzyme
MSWVFLAGARVYKLKKPVRYEFLDFSTPEARREDCEREVKLNRRLAGDVYIGTLALTLDADGRLQLGGGGEPVEWLVELKRLPESRCLEEAIRNNAVAVQDIERVSGLLNGFYRGLEPEPVTQEDYVTAFAEGIGQNHEVLMRTRYGLPDKIIRRLTSIQQRFLQRSSALLAQRVADGRVIEGHGDLRPEHVFLLQPPVVIDCLEFRRAFRILDPVDELGYLAFECERLGVDWIGDSLLQNYFEGADDQCPAELVSFYRLFRICLRAKIAVWHIDDHEINDDRKWLRRARDYLRVAERDLEILAAAGYDRD